MKNILTLVSITTLTILSCTKKPLLEDKYVTLSYKQTFCSDPWTNLPVDSLTLINITSYLNSSSLYFAGLSIKQESAADVCNACFCKTGKTIYVTTFDNDGLKAEYSKIGFR